jgi:predicted amidohydrolase
MTRRHFISQKSIMVLELLCVLFFLFSCADVSETPEGLMEMYGGAVGYDDSLMTTRLKAAAVCINTDVDRETNVSNMENTINTIMAEKPDTQLIVFGETITGWYFKSDEPEAYQRRIAESVPGDATNRIGALSDAYNIYVAFGLSELSGGNLYNSLVLLNPDGNIEKVHRKTFLAKEDVQSGFTPGDDLAVFTMYGMTVGMLVCKDVRSSALIDSYIDEHIEILIHANAFVGNYVNETDYVAKRFNCWNISASRCGAENGYSYGGVYYIAAPTGTIKAGKTGRGGSGYAWWDMGIK